MGHQGEWQEEFQGQFPLGSGVMESRSRNGKTMALTIRQHADFKIQVSSAEGRLGRPRPLQVLLGLVLQVRISRILE